MNRCTPAGFTLVELLVVVALLAVLATVALPALGWLAERNRAVALADLLQSHLVHARTRSVLTDPPLELCGSSDDEQCDGGWHRGWLLRPVGSEAILARHRLESRDQLRWRGFNNDTIRYHRNGTATTGNGRFFICNGEAQVVVQLVINRQGRVRRLQGLEPDQTAENYCGE